MVVFLFNNVIYVFLLLCLCKKCLRIHKTRQNKKRSYKKRTRNRRREIQTQKKTGSTILKEWTTPDFRNTPSNTHLEEEEIVDDLGNDGNASMPEQVTRPNLWRKIMMMMTIQELLCHLKA